MKKLGNQGTWKKYGFKQGLCCFYSVSCLVYVHHKDAVSPCAVLPRRLTCLCSQDCLPPIGLEHFPDKHGERPSHKAEREELLEFRRKYGIDTEDLDQSGRDKKTKRTDLFGEVSKLVSKERTKRNFFGANLDPNHSHFIFADDGGMTFESETRLRADIESCVAGNFNVVGIDNGSGGRILQHVDKEITRMLETMGKGAPSSINHYPVQYGPCSTA